MLINYNKLVRDKIPQVIEQSGKVCIYETISDEQYIKTLDEKLNEECAEYQECKSIEELADILEVIYAISIARKHSVEQLEQIRKDKLYNRGGFEKKILLKEVMEK